MLLSLSNIYAKESEKFRSVKNLSQLLKKFDRINKYDCAQCPAIPIEEDEERAIDVVCRNSSSPKSKLTSDDLNKMINESVVLKKTLIGVVKRYKLFPRQLEALEKRINEIKIDISIADCKTTTARYDILTNSISGCIPSTGLSFEQAYLILTHEMAHSIDPCSYHAVKSEISFNPTNFGRILKYSKPMNYQQSLKEYPLAKLIACQPHHIQNQILVNDVNDKAWNVFCARPLSVEYFADQVGGYMFRVWSKKQSPEVQKKVKHSVASLFCPTRGKVGKLVEGKIIFVEDFIESPSHPNFQDRYDLYKNNVLKYIEDKPFVDNQSHCVLEDK